MTPCKPEYIMCTNYPVKRKKPYKPKVKCYYNLNKRKQLLKPKRPTQRDTTTPVQCTNYKRSNRTAPHNTNNTSNNTNTQRTLSLTQTTDSKCTLKQQTSNAHQTKFFSSKCTCNHAPNTEIRLITQQHKTHNITAQILKSSSYNSKQMKSGSVGASHAALKSSISNRINHSNKAHNQSQHKRQKTSYHRLLQPIYERKSSNRKRVNQVPYQVKLATLAQAFTCANVNYYPPSKLPASCYHAKYYNNTLISTTNAGPYLHTIPNEKTHPTNTRNKRLSTPGSQQESDGTLPKAKKHLKQTQSAKYNQHPQVIMHNLINLSINKH
eukprot:gene3566-2517_t